jgi:hypothetical protein
MPKKKPKIPKEMGRPEIPIDWHAAESAANLHATGEELAAMFQCSYATLERRIRSQYNMTFGEWYAIHSTKGKLSLRRKQYEVAMKGNTTLLCHLGTHWLDQHDKQVNTTVNVNTNVDAAKVVDEIEKLIDVRRESQKVIDITPQRIKLGGKA